MRCELVAFASRARIRAATVPAGGADDGLAPERTRSRDGVVLGASRREPSLPHARSLAVSQRFCVISRHHSAPVCHVLMDILQR